MSTDDTVHEAGAEIVAERGGQLVARVSVAAGTITIGRGAASDLVLPDSHVSTRHAEIRTSTSGTAVVDLGSLNGTWIDDVRLPAHQPYYLHDGEQVRIGPYTLAFHAAIVHESAPPPPPPPPVEHRPVHAGRAAVAAARPRAPMWSVEPPSRYLTYLPDIFQLSDVDPELSHEGSTVALDGDVDEAAGWADPNAFLGRYLCIFESIWEPLEHRQDYVAAYFDPRTCPASFLPWLAGCLDTPLPPGLPESRVRLLLRQAVWLHRRRGTREGLARVIELCTGVQPTITDEPTNAWVIRIQLSLPADSGVSQTLVERVVSDNKPACLGFVLELT